MMRLPSCFLKIGAKNCSMADFLMHLEQFQVVPPVDCPWVSRSLNRPLYVEKNPDAWLSFFSLFFTKWARDSIKITADLTGLKMFLKLI